MRRIVYKVHIIRHFFIFVAPHGISTYDGLSPDATAHPEVPMNVKTSIRAGNIPEKKQKNPG